MPVSSFGAYDGNLVEYYSGNIGVSMCGGGAKPAAGVTGDKLYDFAH